MTFLKLIHRNFGFQVFAAFTVLILLLSLSFICLLARFQYHTKTSELENTGKLMAEILAYQCRLGLYSENESMVQVPVESLLKNNTVIDVSLFNQDEVLVIEKRRVGAMKTIRGFHPPIADVVKQFTESSSSLIFHGDDALVVWVPVMLGNSFPKQESNYLKSQAREDRPIGYVRITMGKKHLKEQLLIIIFTTIALGFGFCAAGALIAYFMSKQIHKPIKQMINSVRKFGAEGVCEDFPVEIKNEIGILARAFQEMTISLKGYLQREIDTAKELSHARSLAQLGLVTSKVTHEVGNLLNSMSLMLERLKVEPLSPKIKKLLVLLEKETETSKSFITDFMRFARKPVLNMRTAPFDQTIREVLAVHQPQADHCDIKLVLDWPGGLPAVVADHRAMHQAFNNLVKNSMEAVGRAGAVKITGRTDGADIVVTVEDTGPGIEPATIESLFEPFFTTKGNQGTGLGLPIVQGIIQAHRGAIVCESVPGEGTRFIITLPYNDHAGGASFT